MAVYDDVRGWNTAQYLGSGEFYLEYGDFDFSVTAPADYTVTGTGVLQNAAQVLTAEERAAARAGGQVGHDDPHHREGRGRDAGAAASAGTGADADLALQGADVRDVSWAAAPNFIWDASGWDGILIQALYPPVALPLWAEAADMGAPHDHAPLALVPLSVPDGHQRQRAGRAGWSTR